MQYQQVIVGNCIEEMRKLEPKSYDLIFADPPFNIKKNYDQYKDRIKSDLYASWTRDWVREASRLANDFSSLYVAINDENAALLAMVCSESGWHMRNWIIWHYGFGTNCQTKFSRCKTHILYFVRNKDNFVFNDHEIRIPSDRQTKYRDKRANKKGKLPSDVWSYPRVCGTFKERCKTVKHPCQMPLELMERIILTSSNLYSRVLDPFCGTGTTLVAADKHGRDWTGIEISESYAQAARERILSGV